MIHPEDAKKFLTAAREREGSTSPIETACHAPFVTLSFQTNGDILVCCRKPSAYLGNIRTHRLADLWRGPEIKELRRALAAYEFPRECAFCAACVANGTVAAADLRNYESLPVTTLEPDWPQRLEFSFSNLCNLACVQCNSELSSRIRRAEGLPPLPSPYDDAFFAELRDFLLHASDICFLGGEPFLQPECWRVFDLLIAERAKCICRITTNGTVFTPRIEKALEQLTAQVTVSLDGVTRETIESIRVGARYDSLMKNLQEFRRLTRKEGSSLWLSFCPMRANLHELPDFVKLAEELDASVRINVVTEPRRFSLFELPREEFVAALRELEERDAEVASAAPNNVALWRSTLDMLRCHANEIAANRMHAVVETTRRVPTIDAGWQKLGEGDLDGAAELAAAIVAHDDSRGDAELLLAEVARQRGQWEDALRRAEQALARSRGAPRLAFQLEAWLAKTHATAGDWTRAREHAAAARVHEAAASPVDAAALELLRALAESEGGDVAARDEAVALAESFAGAAIRPEAPEAEAAFVRLRRSFVDEGWGRLDGRVAEVQERLLDAWSRLAPDDADAGVLRAELFTRRGDVEGADASIADAIRVVETGRASTHRPHWARAARHFGSKRWQEAINDAESAAAHLDGASPEDAREVLFLLSRARRRVRAWESAEMAIDALRRRVAPTPSLHCELGWLRHDEQRYVEALDEVRRALDVSNGPDPAVARDLVALMCALEKHGVRTLSTGPRPARPERAIRPKRKFKEARA